MTASKTPRHATPVKVSADLPTESADVMLRGFEAIRRINERAVQSALGRYAAAAEKMKGQRQPMDLLALPTDLMRSEIEGVTLYWQELGGVAMEMQAELLGYSSHLVDSDALLQATHALDALPLFAPFLPTPTRAATERR